MEVVKKSHIFKKCKYSCSYTIWGIFPLKKITLFNPSTSFISVLACLFLFMEEVGLLLASTRTQISYLACGTWLHQCCACQKHSCITLHCIT